MQKLREVILEIKELIKKIQRYHFSLFYLFCSSTCFQFSTSDMLTILLQWYMAIITTMKLHLTEFSTDTSFSLAEITDTSLIKV